MFPIDIGIRDFGRGAALIQHDVFIMAAQMGNMKVPLTRSVKEVIIPSIAMNFLLGGRPKWKALSAERVLARGSATPILIDNRKLLNAAVGFSTWRISDTEANMNLIDTKVAYAKYHQAGTKHMAQRQFAVLQPKDVDNIVKIFEDWLRTITVEYGNWPST